MICLACNALLGYGERRENPLLLVAFPCHRKSLMKSECADLELLLTARLITNGDLGKKSLFLPILTIGACEE